MAQNVGMNLHINYNSIVTSKTILGNNVNFILLKMCLYVDV
jgi:hypothetical protein